MIKKNMNGKIDLFEISRKLFHILLGVILALGVYLDILRVWMVLIILLIGVIISMLYKLFDIPVIHSFLRHFEREHLRKTFPGRGVIYLFIGLLLLMLIFDKSIVLASLMIWTFGDSISAIVGKHYGRIRNPLNTVRWIEATIIAIIISGIAASFFVAWYYALIAAIIAMIIESIDLQLYHESLDDNFLVPVIAACVLYILMVAF
jgi:dolichol kinase